MAVIKGSKKDIAKLLKGGGQVGSNIPLSPNSPASTDIKALRENTRSKLAMMIVTWIFIALAVIAVLLFVLILLNKQEANLFKDILLTFFGFAQGILVAILGFYFKNNENKEGK